MSEFIRPQVSVEEVSENLARVSAEPLERGYGDTLGNSLRRVLLSSLGGAAVEAIQIDGVQHEFTTVPGVFEDVTDIVLNVKGLVLRSMGTGDEATASINVEGPCVVTGGDFKIPAEFELVNPAVATSPVTTTSAMTIPSASFTSTPCTPRCAAAPRLLSLAALASTPTMTVLSLRSRRMAPSRRARRLWRLPTSSTST